MDICSGFFTILLLFAIQLRLFLFILLQISQPVMKKLFLLNAVALSFLHTQAQQFTGLSGTEFATVNLVAFNPSFIVKSEKGIEVNVFSGSLMAGTNAYSFSKDYSFGAAKEEEDYFKDHRSGNKFIWGNVDLMGPAISFTIKDQYHLGIYTRFRQIVNGGNLSNGAFQLMGTVDNATPFPTVARMENAGFSSHSFSEIGFTYGKEISNDLNNVMRLGVTVKYLMGVAAGSLFSSSMLYEKNARDSTAALKGDITALYSKDFSGYVDNDPTNDLDPFTRAGHGSIGFDLGFQYEYHPYADPNNPTPYTFRIAASITDIGSIAYDADTGSGVYNIDIKHQADWQYERGPYEDFASYFGRLKTDSMIVQSDSPSVFKMGLPTAFRVNVDWNMSQNIWLGVNLLLNLRGDNGSVFRPAYVNCLNVTPRYEKGWFMVGVPFSLWGHQTLSIGTVLRAGPLYIGSTSIISTLMGKQMRNVDAYAGLSLKIPRKKDYNY